MEWGTGVDGGELGMTWGGCAVDPGREAAVPSPLAYMISRCIWKWKKKWENLMFLFKFGETWIFLLVWGWWMLSQWDSSPHPLNWDMSKRDSAYLQNSFQGCQDGGGYLGLSKDIQYYSQEDAYRWKREVGGWVKGRHKDIDTQRGRKMLHSWLWRQRGRPKAKRYSKCLGARKSKRKRFSFLSFFQRQQRPAFLILASENLAWISELNNR